MPSVSLTPPIKITISTINISATTYTPNNISNPITVDSIRLDNGMEIKAASRVLLPDRTDLRIVINNVIIVNRASASNPLNNDSFSYNTLQPATIMGAFAPMINSTVVPSNPPTTTNRSSALIDRPPTTSQDLYLPISQLNNIGTFEFSLYFTALDAAGETVHLKFDPMLTFDD